MEEIMPRLKAGDNAPGFSLQDQHGNTITLSDFKGKKLVLYFYPKADTTGCTKQACSIRDAQPNFAETGIKAVGISPDKPDKQNKFDAKYSLGFTLLSDEDHSVAESYGAWGEKKMYGKTFHGIVRSTFVIDENGKILGSKYAISPTETVPFVMEALAQTSKKPAEKAKVEKKSGEKETQYSIKPVKQSKQTEKPVAAEQEWEIKAAAEKEKNYKFPVLTKSLSKILNDQKYGVLATQKDGEPYGNLVAFAATPDFQMILFITSKNTRKFQNIKSNPKIALLIDNRSNQIKDLQNATAITIIGESKEASAKDKSALKKLYLTKHPNLKEFVSAKDTAIVQMIVSKYIIVSGLDNIVEMIAKKR
jgi:thioredoxin-dependent peroxiredoxin